MSEVMYPPPTRRSQSQTVEPSDLMDEDLALALELSKQEASGAGDEAVSVPPPRFEERESLTAAQIFAAAAAEEPKLPDSGALPTSFARAAAEHVADDGSGSLNDLLLALRLSAEESADYESRLNPHNMGGPPAGGLQRRQSTNLDELLALEMSTGGRQSSGVMDMIAAGISTTTTTVTSGSSGSTTPPISGGGGRGRGGAESSPNEQMRILQQIREEQERQELELALKVSQEQAQPIQIRDPQTNNNGSNTSNENNTKNNNPNDFMWSQRQAMEEYTSSSLHNDDRRDGGAPPTRNMASHRQNSNSSVDSEGRRRELLQRGTIETKNAISSGQAHIVTCRGCGGRLQAPVSYSLVFCPKCQTISPA
jgi:hypothetical protein